LEAFLVIQETPAYRPEAKKFLTSLIKAITLLYKKAFKKLKLIMAFDKGQNGRK
jgi:hypothetical protein